MTQLLISVLGAFGLFAAVFFIGKQKGSSQAIKQTEKTIRQAKEEAASAEAEKQKALTEQELIKQAVKIASTPVPDSIERDVEREVLSDKAEGILKAVRLMVGDSDRRAQEGRK